MWFCHPCIFITWQSFYIEAWQEGNFKIYQPWPNLLVPDWWACCYFTACNIVWKEFLMKYFIDRAIIGTWDAVRRLNDEPLDIDVVMPSLDNSTGLTSDAPTRVAAVFNNIWKSPTQSTFTSAGDAAITSKTATQT